MSFENPTPLRVGMKGALHGWTVRVVGRVVVGMEVDGETYYWNEFNLVDDRGVNGTLVFEDTEEGPEWKLFTVFEPRHTLTAREAATKTAGDTVNFDGTPIEITLVDQSRVYHIEGAAPEGVEAGDVANYFNADTGDRMLVASWTGDEIEFYEGRDVRADEVAQAFGFPQGSASPSSSFRSEPTASFRASEPRTQSRLIKVVGVVLVGATAFGVYSCIKGSLTPWKTGAPAPLAKRAAPPLQLALGAHGTLSAENYTVTSRALMEIGQQGSRFERREYSLRPNAGGEALLIQGLSGAPKEWHLFTPITGPQLLSTVPSYAAARLKKGSPVPMNEGIGHIAELFFTKRLNVDDNAARDSWPATQYGFLARDGTEWIIARWTETAIQFHRGRTLTEADVLAALGEKKN